MSIYSSASESVDTFTTYLLLLLYFLDVLTVIMIFLVPHTIFIITYNYPPSFIISLLSTIHCGIIQNTEFEKPLRQCSAFYFSLL